MTDDVDPIKAEPQELEAKINKPFPKEYQTYSLDAS